MHSDDAPEVAAAIVCPLTILEIPVVARPDQGESVEAVEVHTTGGSDVEPAAVVADPVGEIHLDPAEGGDDVLEAVEVELHEVVDRDPEVLLNGCDELAGTVRERGIDLVELPGPDVVHDEVTRDGKDGDRVGPLVGTQQQDHVRVDAGDACRAAAEGRSLFVVQHAPGRRADEEESLGAHVRTRGRRRGELRHRHPVDLVEPKGNESDLGPGKSEDDHQESYRCLDQVAEPAWSARAPAPAAEPPTNRRFIRVRELAARNVGHQTQTRDAPLRSCEASKRVVSAHPPADRP